MYMETWVKAIYKNRHRLSHIRIVTYIDLENWSLELCSLPCYCNKYVGQDQKFIDYIKKDLGNEY